MGSPIVGRIDCPECGFGGAHVKKSEKCYYRYCPSCGAIYHATGPREAALLAKMRPADGGPPTPTPTPKPEPAPAATPAPQPTPTPAPRPRRVGLFGVS